MKCLYPFPSQYILKPNLGDQGGAHAFRYLRVQGTTKGGGVAGPFKDGPPGDADDACWQVSFQRSSVQSIH